MLINYDVRRMVHCVNLDIETPFTVAFISQLMSLYWSASYRS